MAEFENNLRNDPLWLADIPNNMLGILYYSYDRGEGEHCIIYNIDTKEFNTLPDESGTYLFLNILYDSDLNEMQLIKYQIEYSK